MIIKRGLLFVLIVLLPLILVFSPGIADQFGILELAKMKDVRWTDSCGRYSGADSVIHDGSGLDDVGLKTEQAFGGGADSIIVIEVFSGNYHYNDTAVTGFDGDSTNDITFSGTYAGTVDSFWAVQVVGEGTPDSVQICLDAGTDTTGMTFTDTVVLSVAGDSSEIGDGIYFIWDDTTGHKIGDRWVFFGYGYWADSIKYGIDTMQDTTGWSTWDDTVAIDADSNAMSAGEVYVVFDSIAGHTKGDRWIINLYETEYDERDTIYSQGSSSWVGELRYSTIQVRRRVVFPTASYDSMILILQTAGPDSTWGTLDTDTITATDTTTREYSVDTMKLGPYYRSIYWIMGPENDSENYDIEEYIIFY